jgi:Thymidylate synthase
MQCNNASEMFAAMYSDIKTYGYKRQSADRASPTQYATVEAAPGKSYCLRTPFYNIVTNCALDLRWAHANLLHFFANTEEAACLKRYNKNAARFLTGDKWIGAYGSIAMPQLWRCAHLLKASPDSRRAIISMGDGEIHDINRPACWSFVQFLVSRRELHMLVHQRSLLLSLMPYDCIVLTNMLHFVADICSLQLGSLHWTFGSLHMREDYSPEPNAFSRLSGCILPTIAMQNATIAYQWLERPETAPAPYNTTLGG